MAGATARANTLVLDWCTGVSPISWGFSVVPSADCTEIRLRAASTGISVLSAKAGPGLPEGWTVALTPDRTAVATGPSPLKSGVQVTTLMEVETDRAAASISPQGVQPVKWELRCGDTPTSHSFTPAMELADAVSRGLVLASVRALSPIGPVEVTVDNPTSQPLLLDVPPGTVLRAGDQDWVVSLVAPFDMMRKQKTGRTLAAFPVAPTSPDAAAPRRLVLTNKRDQRADALVEIALAAKSLQATRKDARTGEFEYWSPFDFWPVVQQWAFWSETSSPPKLVLLGLVQDVLQSRAAAGDQHAASIDPVAAAQEVEGVLPQLSALRQSMRLQAMSVGMQARFARFRK